MIDIEQLAIETFQKNYKYFSDSHSLLYEKINILQTAIESGQYRENYALEYINGYFDIKEISSEQFLYGADSSDHAKKAALNVSFKKNESVVETFYQFPYSNANIQDLDKLTIINSYAVGTAPIVHFMNKYTSNDDEMKKIYKFMFFGVGIGQHISEIALKVRAGSYFIVEDNLELFRLSMFVTNYASLGDKATLHFSIMSTADEFKRSYNDFSDELLIKSSYLKFYLLSDSYAPKVKQIQNFAVTKSHLVYPYSYLLHKSLKISQAIHKDYNFLNISQAFVNSAFGNRPVLYLAAGPSLTENLSWIKAHQDEFVIVAVFMIASILQESEIYPDIMIHVDEGRVPVEKTLAKINNLKYFENTLFILSASVALDLFETISKKENVFLVEDRTHYKHEHGNLEFSSVGEAGYTLCLILGAQETYLIGLDLAVDQKTGHTHSGGHNTQDKLDIANNSELPEETATLRDTLISVKGNKQESVLTTPLFDMSIHLFNRCTQMHKKEGQSIYNLSSGAYFYETIPLEIAEVTKSVFDKNEMKDSLYQCIKNASSNELSTVEKNNLVLRKNEVKKKAKVIEKFSKRNFKNIDEFEKAFIQLISAVITPVVQELNEVSDIFLNYFQTVGSHIQALINTKNINHGTKMIKELQEVLSRQLYKILHDIGSFEFNYINGKKYFDVGKYSTRQDEILDFKLTSIDKSQIDEWYAV